MERVIQIKQIYPYLLLVVEAPMLLPKQLLTQAPIQEFSRSQVEFGFLVAELFIILRLVHTAIL